MSNNSLEQLRNAMNQFAQQQKNQGQEQNPMGQEDVTEPLNQNPQFQQPQQNPQYSQGGSGFPPPNQQYNPQHNQGSSGFPPPNQQYNQQYGQGGFPPPNQQMGGMPQSYGGGGYEQQPMHTMPNMPNMGPAEQQGAGGYRTLKQTIIAVNCPKGGVGKTTISKELATAFASVKVGGEPLKVCLVDCDLDFGDVTSMLKMNPYPNITHWTADIRQRLKENPKSEIKYTQRQIEERYLIHHPTGLRILSAPSNHTDALEITGKEVEVVLDNLKACDFDVIILDTGNNTKDYTLISLDKAHAILMVTTLDITTINDARLLLNTLRSIQFPTNKIKLVVNKMPKANKDIDVSEISQVLDAPVIGIVPDHPRIRQLNNSGTPAVMGKDNEFTQAIRKIGNTIVPVFNRAIPTGGKGGRGSKPAGGGFFSRIFKR